MNEQHKNPSTCVYHPRAHPWGVCVPSRSSVAFLLCFLQGSGLMASSLAWRARWPSARRGCFLKPEMRLRNGSLGRSSCSPASLSASITQHPREACPFCRWEDRGLRWLGVQLRAPALLRPPPPQHSTWASASPPASLRSA